MEDTSLQMVLGAIDKMNGKLDDLKDTVAEYTADTAARLAALEEWKRAAQDLNLDNRVRVLENDRVTSVKLEALQAKLEAVEKSQDASKTKERLFGAIGTLFLSGAVNVLVHFFTK